MKKESLNEGGKETGRIELLNFAATAILIYSISAIAMAQSGALEEIVITAQKREQSLQDVPLSVSVTGGETLSNQNFVSLQDFTNNMPAVQVIQGGPSDNLFIRGVGSGLNSGFEQSVGTFIDGIYHGRSRLTRSLFMDIERVEILKGPQSTYFGNNTIAGALNILTRKPGDKFEGYVSALYEPDHGEYNVETAFGGPITDTLKARVALKKWGMDGYIENSVTGEDAPQGDDLYGRTTVVWTPNEVFDATLKVEIGKSDSDLGWPTQLFNCPPDPTVFGGPGSFCGVALSVGDDAVVDDVRSTGPSGEVNILHTHEYLLALNYERWGHTFTSVTGLSNYYFKMNLDIDITSLRLLNIQPTEDYEQFSQEFRVASPTGGRFEYLGGIYYQEGDLSLDQELSYFFLSPVIASIPPFAPLIPFLPFGQSASFDQNDETLSVFASLTWNITDALRTTVGLRWTEVDKDFIQRIFFGTATEDFGGVVAFPAAVAPLGNAFGAALATPGVTPQLSRSDSDLMPSFNVQYDVDDDAMVYASYAEGFKAGGFNGQDLTGDPAVLPFDPESVDAYEVGMKATWLDGAMTTNVALFRSEYKNLQESAPVLQGAALIFAVDNVAAQTSQGVEFEARWAINDRLTAGVSLVYLDAEYDEYPEAGCTAAQVMAFTQVGSCTQDLTGRRNRYAPKYSGNFNLRYVHRLPHNLKLLTETNVFFSDDYLLASDLDPGLIQDAYAKVDARISLSSAEGRWDISIIGKNLNNKLIRTLGTDQPVSPGSFATHIERTRNIAVQARYHW